MVSPEPALDAVTPELSDLADKSLGRMPGYSNLTAGQKDVLKRLREPFDDRWVYMEWVQDVFANALGRQTPEHTRWFRSPLCIAWCVKGERGSHPVAKFFRLQLAGYIVEELFRRAQGQFAIKAREEGRVVREYMESGVERFQAPPPLRGD